MIWCGGNIGGFWIEVIIGCKCCYLGFFKGYLFYWGYVVVLGWFFELLFLGEFRLFEFISVELLVFVFESDCSLKWIFDWFL